MTKIEHQQMLSFFEDRIMVFHVPAHFQKVGMPRILLSITAIGGNRPSPPSTPRAPSLSETFRLLH